MIKVGAKVTVKKMDKDAFDRKVKPYLGVSIDNSKFVDIARIVKCVDRFEQHTDTINSPFEEYVKN